MSAPAEQPLGGNWSAAVRIGETVHRRAGYWTPATQALLAHLERAGFDAAPRPLGSDERGRAVLSFVPGDAHLGWPDAMPAWMYEDMATLTGAADLLRRYHDAAASFTPPADARWRFAAPHAEVICHYDWAPYNALFDGHRPTVMLDWDSAGPGPRAWDLAWAAYTWVPLNTKGLAPNSMPFATRADRFARFCAAYGDVEPGAVLAALVEELPFLASVIEAEARAGDPGSARLAGWDAPAHAREDADLIRRQTDVLLGRA